MRLFISINFDYETKDRLLKVQQRLREKGRGRFASPENLHLTLAFLGDVDESGVPELEAALDSLEFPRLRLCFDKTGCFRRDAELWWIGLTEEPALMKLQKELIQRLRTAGFKPDTKRFRPHITLARDMNIGRAASDELLSGPFFTLADHISLMQSNYPAKKIEYTELYRVYARTE